MNGTTQQRPAWAFEVTSDGVAGTLTIHRETGHWSNTINIETGKIGDAVWVYEATFETVDGQRREMVFTRHDLLWLRRNEKRQASARSE